MSAGFPLQDRQNFTVHDTVYKRVRFTFCDFMRTKHMDCNMASKDSPKLSSFAETLLSLQTGYMPDTLEWCPVPCYHHLLGVGGYELLQGNFYVYLFLYHHGSIILRVASTRWPKCVICIDIKVHPCLRKI